MSDAVDGFRALREVQREEKAERRAANEAVPRGSGLRFTWPTDGVWQIARHRRVFAHFYPGTNRWRDIANNKTHHGDAAAFLEWYGKQ